MSNRTTYHAFQNMICDIELFKDTYMKNVAHLKYKSNGTTYFFF